MKSEKIRQLTIIAIAIIGILYIGRMLYMQMMERAYYFQQERAKQREKERELEESQREGRQIEGYYRREKRDESEWYEGEKEKWWEAESKSR
jgi:FtsZ-interacting cell division protein ZipA